MVRHGERLLDNQLRLAAAQEAKSRHSMLVATGMLTAAAVVEGVAVDGLPGPARLPPALLFAGGLCLLCTALFFFYRAYLGTRDMPTRLEIGWNPGLLAAAAREGDSLPLIHRSTLLGQALWFRQNEATMERAGQSLRRGVVLLLASSILLVGSLGYGVMARAL